MYTIREQCDLFMEAALPKGVKVSEEQVSAMRRCFYAGAFAMLTMLDAAADKLPEEEAMHVISGWHTECHDMFGVARSDASH